MVFESLQDHFDELNERFSGSFALTRLIEYTIRSFTTQEDLQNVQKFYANRDTSKFNSGLEQGLDSIRANAYWLEKDREDVSSFLKKNGYLK